jgi:hypothetical protein
VSSPNTEINTTRKHYTVSSVKRSRRENRVWRITGSSGTKVESRLCTKCRTGFRL